MGWQRVRADRVGRLRRGLRLHLALSRQLRGHRLVLRRGLPRLLLQPERLQRARPACERIGGKRDPEGQSLVHLGVDMPSFPVVPVDVRMTRWTESLLWNAAVVVASFFGASQLIVSAALNTPAPKTSRRSSFPQKMGRAYSMHDS